MIDLSFQLQRKAFVLNVEVKLPSRGVTVIFGPSGCGKTSLLRVVAGFERAERTKIVIDGATWQNNATGAFVPAWQRPIGYVFQEPSLFEHLNAEANMRYGLIRSKPANGEVLLRQAIELLGLQDLLKRSVASLSGGERQRVAIARALATQPKLLLLDEPLASIDLARRNEILPWLERLKDELDLPILYVTHSADELTRLADHVLTLEGGQVQMSTHIELALSDLSNPLLPAEEACTVLQGQALGVDRDWGLASMVLGDGVLWVPQTNVAVGQPMRLRIAASDVSLSLSAAQAGSSVQNHVHGRVAAISSTEAQPLALIAVACGPQTVLARTTRRALHELGLQNGMPVWLHIKAASIRT